MLKGLILILSFIMAMPLNVYGMDSCGAKSYVVIDSGENAVLLSHNEHQEMPMASTTKIMTCFLACESDKLSQVVTITQEMVNTHGSLIYLAVGDRITLLDLIKGAMLSSGNDAANAIAITLGGTIDGFVDMMNNRAKIIGMMDTLFVTPSGLDEGGHHSTAYDMALLTSNALNNELFKSICKLKSDDIMVNGKKRTVYNHNKLLSYSEHFIGVKTGYTDKSGRCLVSAYDYYGNVIICVTLNDRNDWQDHKDLVNRAKKEYKRYNSQRQINVDLVGSNVNKIKCEYEYDIYSLKNVSVKIYYYPFVYAPVSMGQQIGNVVIYNDVKIIKEVPLTATQGINSYG